MAWLHRGVVVPRRWFVAAAIALAALPAVAGDGDGRRVVVKLDVTGELFAPAGRDAEPVRQPIDRTSCAPFP